jgi:hypothetical protein
MKSSMKKIEEEVECMIAMIIPQEIFQHLLEEEAVLPSIIRD